ncbi:hypothetical protein GCM10022255_088460 [Dactylosporangium darangshiense]|uniref:Uncharacterized protein n=1 Tax=Dactylosporangium darangshiense TaxID=579108 RepID=A0ABP8DNH0_9ACTN
MGSAPSGATDSQTTRPGPASSTRIALAPVGAEAGHQGAADPPVALGWTPPAADAIRTSGGYIERRAARSLTVPAPGAATRY